MRFLRLASLVVLLSSLSAVPSHGTGEPAAVVLELFGKLTRLSRPSGGEEPVRKFVAGLIEAAPGEWKKGIARRIDDQGNLLVELPATGKFVGRGLPRVILQAH